MNKELIMRHIDHYTDGKYVRFITGKKINDGVLMSSMLYLTYPELIELIHNMTKENVIYVDTLYSKELDELTILLERE